jgi:hypothetical protein
MLKAGRPELAPADKAAVLGMFVKNYQEKVSQLQAKVEEAKNPPPVDEDEDVFVIIADH